MLSEDKTYRTRDGSRTGIRLKACNALEVNVAYVSAGDWIAGGWNSCGAHNYHLSHDLIEEQPAERPFSYAACPTGSDGRKRAVTRDGREVVLLCDDAPGPFPFVGWVDRGMLDYWRVDGSAQAGSQLDLRLPPPPKRTVWVNLYDGLLGGDGRCVAHHFSSQATADSDASAYARLGDRAFPIEIDAEPTP